MGLALYYFSERERWAILKQNRLFKELKIANFYSINWEKKLKKRRGGPGGGGKNSTLLENIQLHTTDAYMILLICLIITLSSIFRKCRKIISCLPIRQNSVTML